MENYGRNGRGEMVVYEAPANNCCEEIRPAISRQLYDATVDTTEVVDAVLEGMAESNCHHYGLDPRQAKDIQLSSRMTLLVQFAQEMGWPRPDMLKHDLLKLVSFYAPRGYVFG